MAYGDDQFFFLDALPLVCPLLRDLLRRRRIGMVDAAIGIGANLDCLSALATIHDDSLGHLVTGLLRSWQLGGYAVGLRFLDFQFDVLISSQGCSLAGVPSGRNLHESGFAFERLSHMRIDLRTEALRISARVFAYIGKKQLVESGSLRAVGTGTCFGNEFVILLVKRRG